ncbi:class I SAM-dependent methyltransferase [Thermomonospora cellulosilytica]|uniref:SAM-dependent methyltransferase n=1 Tax=Thermomonospora cellulosilytica TaxID=1411118 RepID=A0A7W3RB83_9ACTN|nr:class I SAM-dependent methyltransferase [Thermomonospora cellulosilytica]MBA9006707.1 SAM-dependent methyltransferase [Thermomonospora cellulosilytica]
MDATDPLERWREAVHGWRLPARFRSPDGAVRRPATVVREIAEAEVPPGSRSFAREAEALPAGGVVLDVGCGAGGASLPLAERAGRIVGVDPEGHLLEALRAGGGHLGVAVETVEGRWPDVADRVGPADVVVCHHVLYGVAELGPFAAALTAHARRRVVVEIPERHPLHTLNPLWARFHGLVRPDGPTADDAVAALTRAGVNPEIERWTDAGGWGTYPDLATLADRVRRRLHLPPQDTPRVAEALLDLGVDPDRPRFPGTEGRTLCTIWWDR